MGSLSVGLNGALDLVSSGELNVYGGSIINNGLINLNDASSSAAIIRLHSPALLSGGGQTRLTTDDDNWILSANAEAILTIADGHTILAMPDTIAGSSASRLSAATINNGNIIVDGGGLLLDVFPKTNANLMTAINGGLLHMNNIEVDNRGGVLTSGAESEIRFQQTILKGGVLNGPGLIDIADHRVTFSDGVTLAQGSTLNFGGYDTVSVIGELNNNGLILLNDNSSSTAELKVVGNATLIGNGRVEFRSNDDNIIRGSEGDVLTVGSEQELYASEFAQANSSASRIIASIVNNGTLTADKGGIQIDTYPKINNSLFQSINGGLLLFDSVEIRNNEGEGDTSIGTVTAGEGSAVSLRNSTLHGGLLNGTGVFDVVGPQVTFDSQPEIASMAKVAIGTGDILNVRGPILNNGLIEMNDVGGSTAELRIHGSVSLDGSGKVEFKSNDDNVIRGSEGDILTVGPDQELYAGEMALAGPSASRIIAPIINNGTLTADVGGIQIDTHPKINNSLFQAMNGGLLLFTTVEIHNIEGEDDTSIGTITAGEGSAVSLRDSTIHGGLLNGSGFFDVVGTQVRFDKQPTIAPETRIALGTGDRLTIKGSVLNNGLIELNDVGGLSAELSFDGNTSILGNGRVEFKSNDDNVIVAKNPGESLTIGPDQELYAGELAQANSSASRIMAPIINNGTVTADKGGLQIDGSPKVNNNIFQAINGGLLLFTTVEIHNNEGDDDLSIGTITAGEGSAVSLRNATIHGGLLNGSGFFDVVGAHVTLDKQPTIAPETRIAIGTGDKLILKGDIVNNGLIELNDVGGLVAALSVNGNATISGNGRIELKSNDDNWIVGEKPDDVLTIGPDQELYASELSQANLSASRISVHLINNGTIRVNKGGVHLDSGQKTNNGTFRAENGGDIIVSGADKLTNYNADNNLLQGGKWEVISTDEDTFIDLKGAVIKRIGTGTKVLLSGPKSHIPQLNLNNVQGSFAIHRGKNFQTSGGLDVNGRLEFGLGDGSQDGYDSTLWQVGGDVNFDGAVIDIVSFGVTPGQYEVLSWTGQRTGLPTIGSVPPGVSVAISADGNSLKLDVTVSTAPPAIIGVAYSNSSNTSTIFFQSEDGVSFRVLGSRDLKSFEPLPNTIVGNGEILEYTHQPPVDTDYYFYRLAR